MDRKINFILIILVSCILIQGCIGPKPRRKNITYYTLEYESPVFEKKPLLPATIQIQRFQVAPDYNTEKIVFRKSAFLRDEYNYKRWRSSPSDFATYLLNRDMRESGLFQGVFPPQSLLRSSHLITGTVDEFFEKDGDLWHAALSISITLLKTNEPDVTKRVLFQKSYNAQIPCTQNTTDAFVQAMGIAMATLSTEIIDDIYSKLSDGL